MTRADARQSEEEEASGIWADLLKGYIKRGENGRRLGRLQAIGVIYEALWGIDDWPAKKGRQNNAGLHSVYRLTDTFAEGGGRLTVPGAQ